MDLSIIVPARNEEFLKHTVEDCLAHLKGDTEILVIADGAWPVEPLTMHPRVHVIHRPTPLGQRGAVNEGARVSTAPYILKLDAHCAMADGFDVALLEAAKTLPANVIQIPAQKNLHVFDWVCQHCQRKQYQGPTPTACPQCNGPMVKQMFWEPRGGTTTTRWRFDRELRFNYWGGGEKSGFTETMSCLGAAWFVNRDQFWTWGGLDEGHGGWGQMGTELGCKAWLSGGQMLTNHATWFAHMFRTQGGDFGFPYAITGGEQARARAYSNDLWKQNKWSGQIHPLKWMLDKFWPVPGWSEEDRDGLADAAVAFAARRADHGQPRAAARPAREAEPVIPSFELARTAKAAREAMPLTKGIVYYSDNRPDDGVLSAARRTIEAAGLPIVAVTLKPMDWPSAKNAVLPLARGYLTMFKQMLIGLELLDTDLVFFCEHDVLYDASHFAYTPVDRSVVHYNQHVWKLNVATGQAVHYRCSQTSGLCADRRLLLEHYRNRVEQVESGGFTRAMGFEPGTHRRFERVDDLTSMTWMSDLPNVDIRHDQNLTPSRWTKAQFRNQKYTEGWTESDEIPGVGSAVALAAYLRGGARASQQAVA